MAGKVEALDLESILSGDCLLLEGEGITDDNIAQLAPMLLSGRVKVLDFTNTQSIGDIACKCLADILPKTNVRELGLSCCFNINTTILCEGFKDSKITILNLDAANMSSSDLTSVMSCLPKYIRYFSIVENSHCELYHGEERCVNYVLPWSIANGILSLRHNITITTFLSDYYSSDDSGSGGSESIDLTFADYIFSRNSCIQKIIVESVHILLLIKKFPREDHLNKPFNGLLLCLMSLPYDIVKVIAQVLFSTRNEMIWKKVICTNRVESATLEEKEDAMEKVFSEKLCNSIRNNSESDDE